MKSYTIAFKNIKKIKKLLDDNFIYNENTLIQIFVASADFVEVEKIQTFFHDTYPKSVIIGTTTDGTIDGVNSYANDKSVVSFTHFEHTSLHSTLVKCEERYNAHFSVGERVAKNICTHETKVIISFADGILTNGEEYANGISSIAPQVVLSGGLAGDNGKLEKTYIFDNHNIISCGAVGVALDSKILDVTTNYTFDWIPIGKRLRVTKSVKNRVYEIDGMSAVAIYGKYMGDDLARKLPQIGIEFPLVFEQDNVLIGRAVLAKYDDGSLLFAGNIPEGKDVYFGVGSVEEILRKSQYHSNEIIDTMKYKAEAVFIYSCMARRRFMNKYINYELKALSAVGHFSGFFTYGEFFHTNNKNQLLNESMTILALSENKNKIAYTKKPKKQQYNIELNKEHVLSHLANTVSKELAELNDTLEKRVEESSDYIYQQAYFDKLTGFPNRLSLIQRLDESLGKTIVLINIDDFTSLNDFYGHEFGDKVIIKLSKVIKKFVTSRNIEIFKLPSDEFAIILESNDIEKKVKACTQFINEEHFEINHHAIHVSVTVAAAPINKNRNGFANADMTLKLAKKSGKEYMIFHDDLELTKKYKDNLNMANSIKTAIESGNIIAYYQPIFCIKTGKVSKYEALVRLREPNGTIVAPFAFLEIAQKIKLYPRITHIMIETTFAYFEKNRYDFSLNLSFSDIFNEKTREFLFGKIKEFDIANQLTIEILETQEHSNVNLVQHFINDVYACGAKIAIDDFGSGYANFQHITTMRSDVMKIDGSLIKNIDTDKNARLIVETIIVFARKLNKRIVAEYVHSKEIYDIVEELGIDYAQGFYLGKPESETIS